MLLHSISWPSRYHNSSYTEVHASKWYSYRTTPKSVGWNEARYLSRWGLWVVNIEQRT